MHTSRAWKSLAWAVSGFVVCKIGALLNVLAEKVNGGFMPVFAAECSEHSGAKIDYVHACASGATHFVILTDWIQIPGFMISPGDVLILGGLLVMFVMACATIFSWANILRRSLVRISTR
jgi:hypothetical protein